MQASILKSLFAATFFVVTTPVFAQQPATTQDIKITIVGPDELIARKENKTYLLQHARGAGPDQDQRFCSIIQTEGEQPGKIYLWAHFAKQKGPGRGYEPDDEYEPEDVYEMEHASDPDEVFTIDDVVASSHQDAVIALRAFQHAIDTLRNPSPNNMKVPQLDADPTRKCPEMHSNLKKDQLKTG